MIYLILLVSIFFLLLFKKSKFVNNYFLSRNNSLSILTSKNYFSYFNKNDFRLRGCMNINDCQELYKNNLLEFNENEKDILNNFLEDFFSKLTKYHYIFNNLKLIKVTNKIENGMPHTRNIAIILPEKLITNNYEMNFINLISHEQFHVFQRYNQNLINNLYTNYWNMKSIKNIPQEILDLNRTNPDALPNIHWLFPINNNKYILPMCLYKRNSNNIRETNNIYFTLEKDYQFLDLENEIQNPKLLRDNEEFRSFFGNEVSNNYHPNELSASLFEILIEKHILNEELPKIPALLKLEEFLN
jgi:hypothetical protein